MSGRNFLSSFLKSSWLFLLSPKTSHNFYPFLETSKYLCLLPFHFPLWTFWIFPGSPGIQAIKLPLRWLVFLYCRHWITCLSLGLQQENPKNTLEVLQQWWLCFFAMWLNFGILNRSIELNIWLRPLILKPTVVCAKVCVYKYGCALILPMQIRCMPTSKGTVSCIHKMVHVQLKARWRITLKNFRNCVDFRVKDLPLKLNELCEMDEICEAVWKCKDIWHGRHLPV